MKRTRSENQRLGPAAAAMRRNRHTVFRDNREATEQITVDKLLGDAAAMQLFHAPSKTSHTRLLIYSPEELAMYRQKQRAELEQRVTRGYKFLGNWVKYAQWEAQQKDFARMRAVMERAVAVHGDDPKVWRAFAELEASNGFVAEARAMISRGVASLPACTDLWLKSLILEQTLLSSTSSSRTGDDGGAAVRDVFGRWLATPTVVPESAFRLYALFEAQQQRKDACRDVMRRYVESCNSPDAWLFVAETELRVFGDGARAVKVLEMAQQALPEALLYGPVECRVPLALADALTQAGRLQDARRHYQNLLQRVSAGGAGATTARTQTTAALAESRAVTLPGPATPVSSAVFDDILYAYTRFERLHATDGDGSDTYEALSQMEARKAYEQRVRTDPLDYDAWLSLYQLLRSAARHAEAKAGPSSGSSDNGSPTAQELLADAHACLQQALAAVPASRVEESPYAAQQRAVLVMEFARSCEERGDVTTARAALTDGVRYFPFWAASCPRLWLEAAAFEARQGQLDTARTLLAAGAKASRDDARTATTEQAAAHAAGQQQQQQQGSRAPAGIAHGDGAAARHQLLAAALQLERDAAQRGAIAHDAYLQRARGLYQDAVRATPLDEQLWRGFARLEEQEHQPARAQALYAAAIRTLTAEAARTKSFTHRHALLASVDGVWARRLALQTKGLKKLQSQARKEARAGSQGEGGAESGAVAAATHAAAELRMLYVALLKGIWEDYQFEALRWRAGALEADATAGVPAVLPAALGPALLRWADAVTTVAERFVQSFPASAQPPHEDAEAVRALRTVFVDLLTSQKAVLRRTLGLTEDTTYDSAQSLNAWVELILSPLTKEWAAFEALHGGSLSAVQQHTAPPAKRRTRLLRHKKD